MFREVVRRVLRTALDWLLPRRPEERAIAPRQPESATFEPAPEVRERRGSTRDEHSFEQRRRGGPVTGEAPPKTHGPRHTGGRHKRGRDPTDSEDALFPDLAVLDYDELSVPEIVERLGALDEAEARGVLRYEVSNKARKSVIDAVERRLAG